MRHFDQILFQKIHGLSGKNRLLDAVGVFAAKYVLYFFTAACGLWALGRGFERAFLFAIFTGLIARFGVAGIIYLFFPRRRPFVVLGFSPLVHERIFWQNASFPSGHTIFLFAFIAALAAGGHPAAAWFYILGGGVGLARIFAGVHWPSDIIGGAVIGLFTGLAPGTL